MKEIERYRDRAHKQAGYLKLGAKGMHWDTKRRHRVMSQLARGGDEDLQAQGVRFWKIGGSWGYQGRIEDYTRQVFKEYHKC